MLCVYFSLSPEEMFYFALRVSSKFISLPKFVVSGCNASFLHVLVRFSSIRAIILSFS
jgi:hypothetical protein